MRVKVSANEVETGTYKVFAYVETKNMDHPYFSISMYSYKDSVTFDS